MHFRLVFGLGLSASVWCLLTPPSLPPAPSALQLQPGADVQIVPEPSPALNRIELRAEPAVLFQRDSTFSTITRAPTLHIQVRHETPIASNIIGYTFTQGVYSAFHCLSSGSYITASGYARCCSTDGDCPIFTACSDTSILKNDQFNTTCTGTGSQTVCNTGTIFESSDDIHPKYYVSCWPTWTGGDWEATRTPTSTPGDKGLSKGGIAGAAIGGVVGLLLLVGAGIFLTIYYRRRRHVPHD